MTNRFRTQYQRFNVRGTLLGLAIVAALFAHDAGMAVNAHAGAEAETVAGTHNVHPRHAGAVERASDGRLGGARGPMPHPLPGDCGIALDIARSSDRTERGFPMTTDSIADRPLRGDAPGSLRPASGEPTRPPDVRRALLQVYRI